MPTLKDNLYDYIADSLIRITVWAEKGKTSKWRTRRLSVFDGKLKIPIRSVPTKKTLLNTVILRLPGIPGIQTVMSSHRGMCLSLNRGVFLSRCCVFVWSGNCAAGLSACCFRWVSWQGTKGTYWDGAAVGNVTNVRVYNQLRISARLEEKGVNIRKN